MFWSTWVMIVVASTGTGTTGVTVEFSSKERCEAAAAVLENDFNTRARYGAAATAVCVEK